MKVNSNIACQSWNEITKLHKKITLHMNFFKNFYLLFYSLRILISFYSIRIFRCEEDTGGRREKGCEWWDDYIIIIYWEILILGSTISFNTSSHIIFFMWIFNIFWVGQNCGSALYFLTLIFLLKMYRAFATDVRVSPWRTNKDCYWTFSL